MNFITIDILEDILDIQRQRENDLASDNMSSEHVAQHNAQNRPENMTPALLEQQRERHRVYNLTCEQLQLKRQSNFRRNKFFKNVEQEWYDERPFLCSTKKSDKLE